MVRDDEDGWLVRPSDVSKQTTLSRTTIWRLRRMNQFPAPIRISPGRKAYSQGQIMEWLRGRD
ncbi:helix-turn-helix transcriptional regulator [Hoeflea sp.]|uniref:helix-turn-helix transcriptional regulator n=1 Tax=Hoeflea sp. TaxID=1940281 RepID=UPI003BAF67BD